ncbi:BnaAnng25010D [Brassica napus]|uniref:BnaAnng25010D protein n=4 Tax=Brassica TaxID=3705 RepID=A0A078JPQ3_BRANA|nr:BnaAnng25010D [Brassica napus]VDC70380.1 unnamed protein product [Brassica rapa]
MDPESCLRSISVCESSSGSVLVMGETSDSVSKHVLGEEQNETKLQQGKENDSRTGKDECCNVSAHAVHEVEKDTPTHVSASVLGESDASTKEKVEELFHVVDLSSCGGESDNGQSICRICHVGSDQTPDRVSGKTVVSLELIQIGCKCKNELALAHFHCAEAWFKLRGNSVCEICGCTAKNVTVSLTEEEWSEVIVDTRVDERRRHSRQSCCVLIFIILTLILIHWVFNKLSTKPNE